MKKLYHDVGCLRSRVTLMTMPASKGDAYRDLLVIVCILTPITMVKAAVVLNSSDPFHSSSGYWCVAACVADSQNCSQTT